LKKQVFIEQPPGYVKIGSEHKVYRLKKVLYGLKQAPRAWYSRIEAYFLKAGFTKCPYEHTLFVKSGDKEVNQTTNGIFICQKKYVGEFLDRFQMKDCNLANTPSKFSLKLHKDLKGNKVDNTLYKQIFGSLMYLTPTRPDIMYYVSMISRYIEEPTELNLLVAKRILRYVQGTREFGLFYKRVKNTIYWASLTMIIQEIKMIERVLLVMSLCWEPVSFHGYLRSNQ